MSYDDDDIFNDGDPEQPMADPEIRRAFEHALGEFILAHNAVDFYITKVILKVTNLIRKDHSLKKFSEGNFDKRLGVLELLIATEVSNLKIDFEKLREINRMRNVVSHGHFDENPFDGSFSFIEQKNISNNKYTEIFTKTLSEHTKILKKIASEMNVYQEFHHYIWPPREDSW